MSRQKTIGVFLLTALVMPASQLAWAADERVIEEMVVTGSYLKRTAADSPSPLSVVTSADIQDLGAADVAEIIQTLPWQSGSQTRASTFQGEGADGRNSINLRNLGHGATLVLVNGKRQVASWYNPTGEASVNANGLIPNIAIERIEIVKDGSSALYGSDAVAGVVNFITKKDFDGFDVNYQWTTDEETKEGDANTVDLMLGVQGDRGGIVLSGSYLERREVNIADRANRFSGSSTSGTGQPGRFFPAAGQTITWAANGLSPGNPVVGPAGSSNYPRNPQGTSWGRADVNCENARALDDGPGGILGPIPVFFGALNSACVYDYGSFFSLQGEEELSKFFVTGHYDVTDELEVYLEFANNDSEFHRLNSLNPNAPTLPIATTHPGNIEDAFRRGINPIVVGNGTRMMAGTRLTSDQDRPIDTFTNANYADQRFVVGGIWESELAGRPVTVDVSWVQSEHDRATTQAQDTLSSHMELAINGLGGPNCDTRNGTPGEGNLAFAASGGNFNAGRCYYFNPFGSHRFARDGSRQTDLRLVNPDGLYDWMLGRASSQASYRQRVFEIVGTTELFDIGNHAVGLAVGFQKRRDVGDLTVDSSLKTNNLDFVFGANDWSGELSTTAYFAEIGIPLGDMLQINIAGRYEEFDEIGEDTTDPKITLLFQPTDWLSMRASAGSSFRVASMQQLFGDLTTVNNRTDVLTGTAFLAEITSGNSQLKPETADTYNLGVSFAPNFWFLDGFQIDLDYYNIEYKDIITREPVQTIINTDNAALQAAVTAGTFPNLLAAALGGAGNTRQMVRNAQGNLLRILPDFVNAASADVDGVDLNASYRFDTPFGMWRVGVAGAWVRTYDVVDQRGVKFKSAGRYNATNPVARPLPEFKWNATLAWSMDRHRAFLMMQYIDSLNNTGTGANGNLGGTEAFFRETVRLGLGDAAAAKVFTNHIDTFTTWDVQYTYSIGELLALSDSSVTVGVQNFTDESPPWIPVVTAYDGRLHDPLGRMWFLRMSASM